jgi:hypothetical protein
VAGAGVAFGGAGSGDLAAAGGGSGALGGGGCSTLVSNILAAASWRARRSFRPSSISPDLAGAAGAADAVFGAGGFTGGGGSVFEQAEAIKPPVIARMRERANIEVLRMRKLARSIPA